MGELDLETKKRPWVGFGSTGGKKPAGCSFDSTKGKAHFNTNFEPEMEWVVEGPIYLQFARSSMRKLFGQPGENGQLVHSIVGEGFKLNIELVSVALVLVPILERRHVTTMLARVLLHANLWQFLHTSVLQIHYQIAITSKSQS